MAIPPKVREEGDPVVSPQFRKVGENLLLEVKQQMQRGGLKQFTRTVQVTPDCAVVASSRHGLDTVNVISTAPKKKKIIWWQLIYRMYLLFGFEDSRSPKQYIGQYFIWNVVENALATDILDGDGNVVTFPCLWSELENFRDTVVDDGWQTFSGYDFQDPHTPSGWVTWDYTWTPVEVINEGTVDGDTWFGRSYYEWTCPGVLFDENRQLISINRVSSSIWTGSVTYDEEGCDTTVVYTDSYYINPMEGYRHWERDYWFFIDDPLFGGSALKIAVTNTKSDAPEHFMYTRVEETSVSGEGGYHMIMGQSGQCPQGYNPYEEWGGGPSVNTLTCYTHYGILWQRINGSPGAPLHVWSYLSPLGASNKHFKSEIYFGRYCYADTILNGYWNYSGIKKPLVYVHAGLLIAPNAARSADLMNCVRSTALENKLLEVYETFYTLNSIDETIEQYGVAPINFYAGAHTALRRIDWKVGSSKRNKIYLPRTE